MAKSNNFKFMIIITANSLPSIIRSIILGWLRCLSLIRVHISIIIGIDSWLHLLLHCLLSLGLCVHISVVVWIHRDLLDRLLHDDRLWLLDHYRLLLHHHRLLDNNGLLHNNYRFDDWSRFYHHYRFRMVRAMMWGTVMMRRWMMMGWMMRFGFWDDHSNGSYLSNDYWRTMMSSSSSSAPSATMTTSSPTMSPSTTSA